MTNVASPLDKGVEPAGHDVTTIETRIMSADDRSRAT